MDFSCWTSSIHFVNEQWLVLWFFGGRSPFVFLCVAFYVACFVYTCIYLYRAYSDVPCEEFSMVINPWTSPCIRFPLTPTPTSGVVLPGTGMLFPTCLPIPTPPSPRSIRSKDCSSLAWHRNSRTAKIVYKAHRKTKVTASMEAILSTSYGFPSTLLFSSPSGSL